MTKAILVVEDEPQERISFRQEFEERGYDVTIAESVEDAEAEIQSDKKFSAVVADIHLGALSNAMGIADLARKEQYWSYLVCVSGFQNSPFIEDAKSKCDFYMEKPVDIDLIVKKIEEGEKRKKEELRDYLFRNGNGNNGSGLKLSVSRDPNITAYEQDLPFLEKNSGGNFVAYIDGKKVGENSDRNSLIADVIKNYGKVGLIKRVESSPFKPRFSSPRRKI